MKAQEECVQLALARQFECCLGSPNDAKNEFSFVRCIRLDEREEFPEAIVALLNRWGLQKYYVPVEYGGSLQYFEQPLQLIRMVARRDLTVAIAHGKTFLGGMCAWLASEPSQARQLASCILAGYPVSLGLTEREHGSDLMAGEVNGVPVDGGFRINGEKWLINNATRARVISLLVRTKRDGGPRGFDLLLIDKQNIEPGHYECLPKELTLGIRGADISGIGFRNAIVPETNVVGAPGTGMETLLKSLQVTRTLCASLSLGAGDHALRMAVRFGRERELYGRKLIGLPYARRVLLDAYADQLLAEILTLVGTRSIHGLTDEMSVVSAIVKALVPMRTEAMISSLARFLGARSFLLDVFAEGMFQKIQRDNRIVALFDGNTTINLHAVINQFPALARAYRRGMRDHINDLVCDLTASLPEFDSRTISLIARHGISTLNAMPELASRLESLTVPNPELQNTLLLVRRMEKICNSVMQKMLEQKPARVPPADSFDIAEQCASCYAGAAALGVWLNTLPHVQEDESLSIWSNGAWLNAVYARLLNTFGEQVSPSPQADDALMAMLECQASKGRLFSIFLCSLAEAQDQPC
jgi:alkylation response protein AidB-like acyl-CoA dehydrogenase